MRKLLTAFAIAAGGCAMGAMIEAGPVKCSLSQELGAATRPTQLSSTDANVPMSMGIPAVIERALQVAGSGPTYLSFDIDSIDPGFAPGTGTPEVGGLTPFQVLQLLRGLIGVDVIGGDVVEVAPQYDATTNTAQVAAQVLFEIFCLSAASLKRRKAG